MPYRSFRVVRFSVAVALCTLVIGSVHAQQSMTVQRVDSAALSNITLTDVDVRLFSGDFEQWGEHWNDTSPMPLLFRWKTNQGNVGSGVYKVFDAWGNMVEKGSAGKKATGDGAYQHFTIDFGKLVGGNSARPLTYSVVVSTIEVSAASAPDNRTLRNQENSRTRAAASLGREIGQSSKPVLVTIGAPGAGTQFTDAGLNPALLERMDIRIDLERLDIYGKGYDEDPYLFVAVIFADGTTIVPTLDSESGSLKFTGSTVRVATAARTHENVPGGDPGDKLPIPPDTGHFSQTIKPIGLSLARTVGASQGQIQQLRESTTVAILVIGMEEDAVPSTDVVNQSKDLFVRRLTEELNKIVADISIPLSGPIELPDLQSLTGDLRKQLKKELEDFAKAEGLDEIKTLLAIPAWPMVLAMGGANADDYIGQALATYSYQQILDAGTEGITFELKIDQNCKCDKPRYIQSQRTEEIMYEVIGRIRRVD